MPEKEYVKIDENNLQEKTNLSKETLEKKLSWLQGEQAKKQARFDEANTNLQDKIDEVQGLLDLLK